MKKAVITAVLILFFSSLLFSQQTVGVLDISPKQGISEMEADIVTDFVYDALYRFGGDTYMIISRQNREALLAEHEFSLSGFCDDTSCALEVGKYLSADYVIIGSFTKFGSKYYLSLQLVDVNTTAVSGSSREGADDLDDIAGTVVDACVAGVFGSQEDASSSAVQSAPAAATASEAMPATPPDLKIGDRYAGGIVFYLDGKGGGLVCAEENQSTSIEWAFYDRLEIGNTSTTVGTGAVNTEFIVSMLSTGIYAAQLCYDLELNGYDDWFLPSKDELNLMYENLSEKGLSDFSNQYYWSSSEYGSYFAWLQRFGNGSQDYSSKGNRMCVRAVRAFSGGENDSLPEAFEPISAYPPDLRIGDWYAGGIIFYLDGKGGGLVCTEEDYRTNIRWGDKGIDIGTTSTIIGTGAANTEAIISQLGEGTYAAKLCYNLELNGYDDWFLPSKDELDMMYENLYERGLCDFANRYYWSSSETSSGEAWCQSFNSGDQKSNRKNTIKRIRAVRIFSNREMISSHADQQIPVVESETDLRIGGRYAGGIVFYLDGKGGGMVCAEEDQSTNIDWGDFTTNIGTTAPVFGAGATNTEAIVSELGEGDYAAKLCYDLELNGYDDWFLPSKDELEMMYRNLHWHALGGFVETTYWSSSESNSNSYAWFQDFSSSLQNDYYKHKGRHVRAVRAFSN